MISETFKKQLEFLKESSDDPDTQVTCLVTTRDGLMMCGANRIPFCLKKTRERTTRPAKYNYISHAEASVIADAARAGYSLYDATMYLNWFPCCTCAQSIINAGFTEIVCNRKAYEERKDDPRYTFAISYEILTEAGVNISWYD